MPTALDWARLATRAQPAHKDAPRAREQPTRPPQSVTGASPDRTNGPAPVAETADRRQPDRPTRGGGEMEAIVRTAVPYARDWANPQASNRLGRDACFLGERSPALRDRMLNLVRVRRRRLLPAIANVVHEPAESSGGVRVKAHRGTPDGAVTTRVPKTTTQPAGPPSAPTACSRPVTPQCSLSRSCVADVPIGDSIAFPRRCPAKWSPTWLLYRPQSRRSQHQRVLQVLPR